MIVSNFKKANILVIGAGSIGIRHIKNLIFLGFKNIFVYRHSTSSNLEIDQNVINVISKWEDVKNNNFHAVLICSPTSMHLKQAIDSLNLGAHVFIEKPLSHSRQGTQKLKNQIQKTKKYVFVAYMLRFHPLLLELKKIVKEKKYGNLISFTSKWGEYLPNWHPWEDYTKSYAARKELGGGVALTLSHDIDILNWIVESKIKRTSHIKNYASNLILNVEGGSDIIYQFENGVTGHTHLNYYSKIHERYIELTFDNANIRFDYLRSTLSVNDGKKSKIKKVSNFDRNKLFIDELKYFFKMTGKFNIEDSLKSIDDSELILNVCTKKNWINEK